MNLYEYDEISLVNKFNKMNNQPLISIIITTYNRAHYIVKAIKSILSQNYQNIEIIIVDDGSTDGTKDFVQPYLNDKKIYYIYQKNQGVSVARNNGIKSSNGKYIAILDSDDFWYDKEKLQKQADFLEKNSDYVLTGGGVVRINEKGREIVRYLLPEKDEDIRRAILQNNCFAHSAVVFKKEFWQDAGGYDETLDFSEDWDLWMKFGKLGKYYNFQEYFLVYLKAGQNTTSGEKSVVRANAKIHIKLRKKYRKNFPGFWKAYLFGWAYYFYSFLPFRQKLRSILFKLKKYLLISIY